MRNLDWLKTETSAAKPHCCAEMAFHIESEDEYLGYVPKFNEYGINVKDGGTSHVEIRFCPWCGERLPNSKRDEWFNELESLWIDPFISEIPERYESDEWRKGR